MTNLLEANPTRTCVIEGIGLITGRSVTVTLQLAQPGCGVTFYLANGRTIQASLDSVVQTVRGVTIANSEGDTLSIVEHFLAATVLSGHLDLDVKLSEDAVELPLLDGSAQVWIDRLNEAFGSVTNQSASLTLLHAMHYDHTASSDPKPVQVYALPSNRLQITYSLDFPHPEVQQQFVHWDASTDTPDVISQARTFGMAAQLPALQAKGLALGVTADNTLGLNDDGSCTSDLRFDQEPLYHKCLDLLGDLRLAGINPLALRAHIIAINAGHGAHIAFARRLLSVLPQ